MSNPREPIDHAFRMGRLNVWFAAGAILTFLVFVAAVFFDHEREWKRVQARWFDLERERTSAAMEAADAKVSAQAREQAEAKIAAAEAAIGEHEKDLVSLAERANHLDAKAYKVDQAQRFEKALIASQRYVYEGEAARGSEKAPELAAQLDERRGRLDALTLELQGIEAEKAGVTKEIAAITGTRDGAIKERDALFVDRERQARKLRGIEHSLVNDWFRDRPLVDFISPMYKVNQVVVDGLHNEINYLTIPRVDRCQTCHLGIDKAGYDDVDAVFRSHPRLDLFVGGNSPHPVDQFGCTICHLGRDRATTMVSAAHTPSDDEEAHRWHEEYDWHTMHYWDYPMLKTEYTESSCALCHTGVVDVPGASKLNHGMFLVENMGCTGCHKIQGREEVPKAGPSLVGLAGKTTAEWAFHWVKNPKEFRATTRMPRFFDLENTSDEYYLARNNVEAQAMVSYLFDVSKPVDLRPMPGTLSGSATRGEVLVHDVGCRGCHLMEGEALDPKQPYRRFGPALTGLGSKTTMQWIYNWVKDPKHVMPTTRMPNMRLSDQEALDIAAYLVGLRAPAFEAKAPPAADDTLRDAVLLEYLKVTQPDREARETLGALAAAEKNHLLGEKLIARYGCAGCHVIEGFENAQGIGTELTEEGSKSVHRFDFSFVDIPHTRHDWIYTKLTEPRIFDRGRVKDPQEKLRMPDYGLTDEEADAITLAVLSMRKRNIIQDNEHAPDPLAEKGWRIVRNQNCRGCHSIDGEGGDFRALVGDPGLAPPILNGQGDRVQADWLFSFLKEPSSIRPWLSVRMPTFEFSDEQASDLVRYFAATAPKGAGYEAVHAASLPAESVARGKEIFTSYKCLSCHQLGEQASGRDPADLAPDMALAPTRLRPGWIADWLRDPQVIMPDTRMPSFFYSEGEAMFDDADQQIEDLRNYILTLGEN